ncbi:hypothetical protein GN244_ATG09273 [Phytophthora infestans]|uniref:Uncharacterized protein n=1 Tax=Phytophthora infestans TaxID=4787 RepID=A0A833SBA3_PHYIN|nr:hypothetical protein GN244_ATG09273 [Phytophthora infestans]KAF4133520.1 hypothetical protein GN958_ATG17282 [Phytophthora infestans]
MSTQQIAQVEEFPPPEKTPPASIPLKKSKQAKPTQKKKTGAMSGLGLLSARLLKQHTALSQMIFNRMLNAALLTRVKEPNVALPSPHTKLRCAEERKTFTRDTE